MKTTFFLTGLLILTTTFSQSKEIDTLGKYSYQIFGISDFRSSFNDFRQQSGTGFFIRDNAKLYFVTAKHVLLGCMGYNRINNPAKELLVIVSTSNNPLIKIEIKDIKDTSCAIIPKTPDVSTYEVLGRYNDTSIHSIENLIAQNWIEKIDSITFYGFPHSKTITKMQSIVFRKIEYIKNHKYYDSTVGLMRPDITEYVFRINDVAINLDALHGYSGSPIFIKESENEKWKMVGILIRYINTDKIGVLKQKFIFDSIKNHKE